MSVPDSSAQGPARSYAPVPANSSRPEYRNRASDSASRVEKSTSSVNHSQAHKDPTTGGRQTSRTDLREKLSQPATSRTFLLASQVPEPSARYMTSASQQAALAVDGSRSAIHNGSNFAARPAISGVPDTRPSFTSRKDVEPTMFNPYSSSTNPATYSGTRLAENSRAGQPYRKPQPTSQATYPAQPIPVSDSDAARRQDLLHASSQVQVEVGVSVCFSVTARIDIYSQRSSPKRDLDSGQQMRNPSLESSRAPERRSPATRVSQIVADFEARNSTSNDALRSEGQSIPRPSTAMSSRREPPIQIYAAPQAVTRNPSEKDIYRQPSQGNLQASFNGPAGMSAHRPLLASGSSREVNDSVSVAHPLPLGGGPTTMGDLPRAAPGIAPSASKDPWTSTTLMPASSAIRGVQPSESVPDPRRDHSSRMNAPASSSRPVITHPQLADILSTPSRPVAPSSSSTVPAAVGASRKDDVALTAASSEAYDTGQLRAPRSSNPTARETKAGSKQHSQTPSDSASVLQPGATPPLRQSPASMVHSIAGGRAASSRSQSQNTPPRDSTQPLKHTPSPTLKPLAHQRSFQNIPSTQPSQAKQQASLPYSSSMYRSQSNNPHLDTQPVLPTVQPSFHTYDVPQPLHPNQAAVGFTSSRHPAHQRNEPNDLSRNPGPSSNNFIPASYNLSGSSLPASSAIPPSHLPSTRHDSNAPLPPVAMSSSKQVHSQRPSRSRGNTDSSTLPPGSSQPRAPSRASVHVSQGPQNMSRVPSAESIVNAPSMLQPTISRTSIPASVSSETRKKGSIFGMFRSKATPQTQAAPQDVLNMSSAQTADRGGRQSSESTAKVRSDSESPPKMTSSSDRKATKGNLPPPIAVPIHVLPSGERKSPNSKFFTPFRSVLATKRHRTISTASMDARDSREGTAVSYLYSRIVELYLHKIMLSQIPPLGPPRLRCRVVKCLCNHLPSVIPGLPRKNGEFRRTMRCVGREVQ